MAFISAPQISGTLPANAQVDRLKLQDSLRSAADILEAPYDVTHRLFNAHLEIAVVKAGCDLGLFKALDASTGPLSVQDLAAPVSADPLLVGRLLRYLASVRMVTETGKDLFAPSNSTRALADSRIHDAIYYIFNVSGPAYQALPDFLQANKYQSQTSGASAFQKGLNTGLDFFPWAKEHPERLGWFQQLMSVPREGDWLDVFDFGVKASQVTAGSPLFVDVGGSTGHQSSRLRAKYPDIPGRIIVQDLSETIANATPIKGVEFMVHNFFEKQPVQGAKFYYLRTVLHDWGDDKAELILRNLVPAMASDSVILIDELALPTTGTHWWSASLDLHMYTMLGALERNIDQWKALLERAGLKLVEIQTYTPAMRHSLIVAAPL